VVKEKGVDGKIETFCFLQLTDPEGYKIQRLIRVASIDQILGVVRSHALQEEMQWEESRKLTSAKKSRNARAKRAMNEQELEWDRDPRLPSLSIKPILSVRAFTESFLNNAQQMVFMTILLTYPVLSIMLRKRFRKNNNFDDWMTAFQGSKKFKQVNVTKHVKTRFADVAGLEQPKLEIQEFVDFLKANIKVNNKKGELGDVITVTSKGNLVTVTSAIPFSKRYLKYLTKKYLKQAEILDYLKVNATKKDTYKVKYVKIDRNEEEEEDA